MQAHDKFVNCQSLPYKCHDVAVYHHALSRYSDSDLTHLFVLTFVSCTGPSDFGRDEYKRDMANLRAMINKPTVISTTTLQEMGGQANKKPKMEVPLPQVLAVAWESPIWAQFTSSSVQLLEADKGQKKGLQSLFAHQLPTAPVNTPFVFHDVHTRPSVCGSDLKPDVVMGLCDKPCNPLTTGAIINFKRQGGGYDNDENVGKAIMCGRVFLQQLPRSLRSTVLVGLTDLCSITLVLVRLDLSAEGGKQLVYERSARLPDARHTLLQLLSCEPQRWLIELPNLGQASKSWACLVLEQPATCMKLLKASNR